MKYLQNENTVDRLVRFLLAEIFALIGFFWTGGTLQIVLFVLSGLMLFTASTGFCVLYLVVKCNTKSRFPKPLAKKVFIPALVFLVIFPFVFAYFSDFFSKKFFLEDFNRMNNFYKQTLFNTGQDKRSESVKNYESLAAEYEKFYGKYRVYQPAALKGDGELVSNLDEANEIIVSAKDQVYNGDLKSLHTKLEAVRPLFQGILKRNNFSMLGVALVDFHDSMEKSIAAADEKSSEGVLATYQEVDEKLKAVEAEASDEEIQQIRKNLEDLMSLAREGKGAELSKKAAELKSSFIKVYLKRG